MKKAIYTLLLLMAALGHVTFGQQRYDFMDKAQKELQTPMAGVTGGPNGSGEGIVGAIGGVVDVGGLGAATYTIPIEVPQGIGGIQPNLSIVYNSQSGNGLLGWGWNLAGASAITRTGADFYHDGFIKGVDFGHVTGNGSGIFPFGPNTQRVFDRFSLDGQRLILVEGLYYGQNNSQYKTEVDGMSKIVAYTESGIRGPAKFKVWTADGLIMEYGFNNNARMIRTCPDNSNLKEVGAWLLNRVEDRNGNFMLYQYDVSGGQYSLYKVYYSGNTNAKTDERGLACYSVNFIYQDRIDSDITFIGNHVLKQNKLLTSIEIRWWDQLVSQYDFGYHEINPNLGYFFHRLKNVTYSRDGVAYNPTIIDWGNNDYGISVSLPMTGVEDDVLTYEKNSGDFNGDGMGDFIAIEEKIVGQNFLGNDIYKYLGHVYYNEGVIDINGQNKVKFSFQYTIDFGDTKPAIFAADFDGDGRDDMVTVVRKRKPLWFGDPVDYLVIRPYINCYESSTQSWKLYASYRDWIDKDITLSGELPFPRMMIGDFLGRGKNEIVIQIPEWNDVDNKLLYITYLGDCRFHMRTTTQEDKGLFPGRLHYAADFDGDGLLEVYCQDFFGNDPSHIYKMTSESTVRQVDVNNPLTNENRVYIGDYNGDGKTDVLTIHSETKRWKLYLFKQDRFHEAYDVEEADLPTLPFNHEDISIQDFNGDGKADVFVRKLGGGVDVYFSPLIFDEANLQVRFSTKQHFSNNIGSSSLIAGNFLGQENPAILRKNFVFSLKPISNRYNAKTITDGMGNRVEFEYDYLTAFGSSVYSWSKYYDKPELDIYSTPIPIKAVKKVTASNLYAESPTTSTHYCYSNALVHRKGRGMLGFLKTITMSYINEIRQDSVVTEYTTDPIEKHRALSLKHRRVYNNLNNLVLLERHTNSFMENSSNSLVYIPVVTKKQVLAFNPDVGESEMLSKSITDNVYRIDEAPNGSDGLGKYHHSLKLTDIYEGMTGYQWTTEAVECPYVTHTQTIYQPDSYIGNWIINRPDSTIVKAWKRGDPDISKSLITYQYRNNTSYLVERIESYPGGNRNNANRLATATDYKYDLVGNVDSETLTSLDGFLAPRTTTYTYQDFLFPKTETNAMGYVSQTHFNAKFGELQYSTDCNGQTTYYNRSDHLGSTEWVQYPDLTFGCTAKRWARHRAGFYDPDSPPMAAYYTWKRISGEAPVKVFFDAAGRELRTVAYGLHGETIYQDTEYNSLGLVKRKSLPYFPNEPKQWTSYYYDGLLRPTDTYYPDGTHQSISYDGFTTTSTFHTTDGETRTSSETANYLGQKTTSVDAAGTEVTYGYFPDGKLKWTQVGDNPDTQMTLEYDDAGNRTKIHDPNYGLVTETYDAFGQLRTSMTPKGDLTEYDYDVLGRCFVRIENDEVHHTATRTRWIYSEDAGQKGLLRRVEYGENQTITYDYDAAHLNRLLSKTERLFGTDYTTTYTYDDAAGFPLRVQSVTYPTGYETRNVYDPATGQRHKIEDGQGNALWETLEKNALGQITRYTTGNGVESARDYYPTTGRLQSIYTAKNQNILQYLGYEYDDFSNLAARYDKMKDLREIFGYDELDRLTDIRLNGNLTGHMSYDALGRMTDKHANGSMVFASAQHDYVGPDGQLRPHAVSNAQVLGNPFPTEQLDIDYTMFDKVRRIADGIFSPTTVELEYGYDHQRTRMRVENPDDSRYGKTYVDGCEFVEHNGIVDMYTYLCGPLGVFAVNKLEVNGCHFVDRLHYVYKDHLGSWTTITDANGNIVREQSFDAWGNMRDPDTWTGTVTQQPMFDRGFTGHEHLNSFGLINMNGRMYDPIMSSFLSVDNYVQFPDFSQNFNRYAYCLNNPLKYTDPSGEELCLLAAVGIAAVVNVTMNGINNLRYGESFFHGAGQAAVVGAVQGLFTYGIGESASVIGSAIKNPATAHLAKAGFQLVAHGTMGGMSTMSRGGKFWHGFVSSATASVMSTAINQTCIHFQLSEGLTKTAMIAGGALSGGISAKMAGGDFIDGFCNGLICAGLNHALHTVVEGGVRLARFKMMTQDAWAKNPEKCKFVALAMAEYSLLGENARTPEQIEDAWNEIARTEKNESVRYQKVLAQNGIGIRDTQSTLNDIDGSEMYNIISSDNPVLVLSYYENFNGEYIRAHASLLIGVSDGNNSFEIADPMYTDTYYRTSGNMGKDPYNQRTTLYNKFYYFQLYKK